MGEKIVMGAKTHSKIRYPNRIGSNLKRNCM